MTKFEDAVYAAVCRIPRGKVASYGAVAAAVGKPLAARAVGNALHKNPFFGVVPCHRVVAADGSLAEAFVFGGKNVQQEMLEREGVKIKDGKVLREYWLTHGKDNTPDKR